MMLIPPTVNLGNTETDSTSRERFYSTSGIYSANITPNSTGGSELSSDASGDQNLYQSSATESRMFLNAPKMQSDLPGFHMHAAAAVVTGHPGSFPLNSSASYAAGAATTPSHSIVPPHYGSPTLDPTPYYSPLAPGYDMKSGDMWNGGYSQPPHTYYQYDQGFAHQYPYDRCYPMDMNDGVRRKNATRESTNTLKAWLQEHKKNPYPTKGEKIMLAIITKMTLTQVSTWFANARRRLKKENKMTWIPKNRANETGSGTDDRRASDDKDSDDKSDDEDCKSDKDEIEESPDDKPEGEQKTESCQFNHQNSSLAYHQPQNSLEPIAPDVTEQRDVKPVQEYGGMMRGLPCDNQNMLCQSAPNNTLSDKLHSANLVQNPSAIKYETGSEGYNRPIWSPIESQSDKPLPSARPYQPVYGADFQCQGTYPQDPDGHRHSTAHPHTYPTNYDMPALPHISMSNNSQESHHLHNHSASSHMRRKIFSPMSQDIGKHIHGTGETELAQDSIRSNDYTFSSPMTNLRNYVNGAFQGSQQVPGATMCDKMRLSQQKSPTTNADPVLSPDNGGGHYQQHHQIEQSYLQQRQGQVDHTMSRTHPAYSHSLHRSMSGPYSSYYGDGTNCYPPQSLTEPTQLHPNNPYYSHQANPTNSTELSQPDNSTTAEPYHSSHKQQSPSSCRQTTGSMADRSSSTCIGYYDGQGDGTSVPPARSTVPPPPYINQCKYADANAQTFMNTQARALSHRQSYDGLNPGSNQSATSQSPRGVQSGHQTDANAYGCVAASDDEDMRKIQSSEAISDKVSR